MRFTNSLLVTAALLVTANCSSASTQTATNNAQNTAQQTAVNSAANANGTQNSETTNQKTKPDAIVKDLYAQHDKETGYPFYQNKSRALVDKYFTKQLADLIWKDAVDSKGEVGALDNDPLYISQDGKITDLKIQADQVDGDQALVLVTFKNTGKAQTMIFNVEREKSVWKIANITSDDYNLLDILQSANGEKGAAKSDNATRPNVAGEFDGTYQVGDVTCTVTPIKMAFEVRWSKGSGSEIFFFQDRADDKYIFASDPKTGKANVFSFDDENYNTGTFTRADGKELAVKRAK